MKAVTVKELVGHFGSSSSLKFTALTVIISFNLLLPVLSANIQHNEAICKRILELANKDRRRTSVTTKVDLWPKGVVPFKISKEIDKRFKKYIYQAMNEYHQHSCIRFEPKKTEDKLFVNFINSSDCSSTHVGRATDGMAQNISLGPGCYYKGTIVHEIGHALGFEHEHQRSDSNQHIVIHLDKLDVNENMTTDTVKSMEAQFKPNSKDEECNLSSYDLHSVMHYGMNAFANAQGKTITQTKTNKSGVTLTSPTEKYGLSELDIDGVNTLYGCKKRIKKMR